MPKVIRKHLSFLFKGLVVILASSQAAGLEFHDVARDESGNVIYMKKPDAAQYCANHGARLPSFREFVKLSEKYGAKGRVDAYACGSDSNCYYKPYIEDADGRQYDFYYNYSGYQRPNDERGEYHFWSSSIRSSLESSSVYTFDGKTGSLHTHYALIDGVAVRCVTGPYGTAPPKEK